MRSWFRLVLPLLLFSACSPKHPLAGEWVQEAAPEQGMELEFQTDGKGAQVLVHGVGDTDHADGTYELERNQVRITGKWRNADREIHWVGILEGERIEFAGDQNKVVFRRGAAQRRDH